MKHSIIFTGIITLALSSQLVSAGSITDTYATGDTLTATKMDNIKAAVNDNDARVGAIETQTSDLITGCPTGQSIRSIAADGAIACEVDSIGSGDITGVTAGSGLSGGGGSGTVTLSLSGAVSISNVAFEDKTFNKLNQCILYKGSSNQFSYYLPITGATSANCDAWAGVTFPDGVKITRLDCLVWDNFATNTLTARLERISLTTGARTSVFGTGASVDSTSVQTISDTSPVTGTEVVNNSLFAYRLGVDFSTLDFTTISLNARIYGCKISYN